MKHSRLILIALVAIGSLVFLVGKHPFSQNKSSLEDHEIMETASGTFPAEVTIRQGDSVRFTSQTGKPFWPASDLHPSHSIYPEFDPKRPINPSESWSFIFSKSGRWRYHDHLNPGATGIINVTSDGNSISKINCSLSPTLTESEREQCWDNAITVAVETKGVKAGLDILHQLYKSDPYYVQYGCHKHAHQIGEVAYSVFLKKPVLDSLNLSSEETTSCGYGFWHGFLEHLIRDNPSIQFGRQFCSDLVKKYSTQAPNINITCYHGMGHGFMPDPPDKTVWGKAKEMVLRPLQLCDQVSITNNANEIGQCHQGVFNVLADWTGASRYGLKPNLEDPLGLCAKFDVYEYKYSCYYEFGMRISAIADDDITKAAVLFVNKIPEDNIASMIIDSAMASIIERSISKINYDNFITSCQNLQDRLKQGCLTGIVGGLMAHGEPGLEYVKTINFCKSKLLEDKYIDNCYHNLSQKLKIIYSKDKMALICETLDEKYRKYCRSEGGPKT